MGALSPMCLGVESQALHGHHGQGTTFLLPLLCPAFAQAIHLLAPRWW